MKTLLRITLAAAALCAAAFSAKAAPMLEATVKQTDFGWVLKFTIDVVDLGAGSVGPLFVDGIENIYHAPGPYYSFGTIVTAPFQAGKIESVGTHTLERLYTLADQSWWLSTEYTIAMPTSTKPVPDGGTTAALLAGGLMGLVLLRGVHRPREA